MLERNNLENTNSINSSEDPSAQEIIVNQEIIAQAEKVGLSIESLKKEIDEMGGPEKFQAWLNEEGNKKSISLLLKKDFWEGLQTMSVVVGLAGMGASITGAEAGAPQYAFIIPAIAAGLSAVAFVVGRIKEKAIHKKSQALSIKRKMIDKD